MIDLHTHILPGIDDGPATLAESLHLARDTVAAGVGVVVATPHVSARYPNDADRIEQACAEFRTALAHEGIDLVLHAGAELTLEQAMALPDAQLRRMRLGDGPYLLLECPLSPSGGDPGPVVETLQQRGYRILLAHPERSPIFQKDPQQAQQLVAHGALTSVTASALDGRFGRRARRTAHDLLAAGLVHNLVSDMHDGVARPAGVIPRRPVGALTPDLDWMVESVPVAILSGAAIPTITDLAAGPGSKARVSLRRRLARRR